MIFAIVYLIGWIITLTVIYITSDTSSPKNKEEVIPDTIMCAFFWPFIVSIGIIYIIGKAFFNILDEIKNYKTKWK